MPVGLEGRVIDCQESKLRAIGHKVCPRKERPRPSGSAKGRDTVYVVLGIRSLQTPCFAAKCSAKRQEAGGQAKLTGNGIESGAIVPSTVSAGTIYLTSHDALATCIYTTTYAWAWAFEMDCLVLYCWPHQSRLTSASCEPLPPMGNWNKTRHPSPRGSHTTHTYPPPNHTPPLRYLQRQRGRMLFGLNKVCRSFRSSVFLPYRLLLKRHKVQPRILIALHTATRKTSAGSHYTTHTKSYTPGFLRHNSAAKTHAAIGRVFGIAPSLHPNSNTTQIFFFGEAAICNLFPILPVPITRPILDVTPTSPSRFRLRAAAGGSHFARGSEASYSAQSTFGPSRQS
jgi:hypothetical protein